MEDQNRSVLRWCLSLMAVGSIFLVVAQMLRWPPENGRDIVSTVLLVVTVVLVAILMIRSARAGLWARDQKGKQ